MRLWLGVRRILESRSIVGVHIHGWQTNLFWRFTAALNVPREALGALLVVVLSLSLEQWLGGTAGYG